MASPLIRLGTGPLRVLAVLLALIFVLVAGGAAWQAVMSAGERGQHPPPGELVQVGDLRMHIWCTGEGSPTVILDAGGGDSSLTWSLVQPELARSTRVCSYDRPGLGWSDNASGPADAHHAAERQHELLAAAGEEGPYLLVGHSAAGLYQRVFAARHPTEVMGVVLVDPTPLVPGDDEQVLGIVGSGLPLPLAAPWAFTGLHRAVLWPGIVEDALPTRRLPEEVQPAYRASRYRTSALPTGAAEEAALRTSIDQALAAGGLGDTPIIVLVAEIAEADRHAIGPELLALLERAKQLQARHADSASSGETVMVPDTGHFIHVDRREVVLDAVRSLLGTGDD